MLSVQRTCRVLFRLLFLLDGGVWSLRNMSISVPRGARAGAGEAAVLRCDFDLEGAALYATRWYRADAEFYRYVPREHPPALVFPLPGATVDLTQSDGRQVRLVGLHPRLSGAYQCEVSADAPLFHTDIRSAPFTVVAPPFRAPELAVSRTSYSRGDIIRANCSVDAAFPAPNITWLLDGQEIAKSVFHTPETDFKERNTTSRIEISVVDGAPYRSGLAEAYSGAYGGAYSGAHSGAYIYSSTGTGGRDQLALEFEAEDDRQDNVLRYALSAPTSGQLELVCESRIFEVYARRSEAAVLREDAPRPASVTGEDSSGAVAACSGALAGLCACAALLAPLAAL